MNELKMNLHVMNLHVMNLQVMDLKVCEACGALWVRSRLSRTVYCRRCAVSLADYPAARSGRRRTRATAHPATQAAKPSQNNGPGSFAIVNALITQTGSQTGSQTSGQTSSSQALGGAR